MTERNEAMKSKIDPGGKFSDQVGYVFRSLGTAVGDVNVLNGWDTSRSMLAHPDNYDSRWQTAHKIAELGLVMTEASEAIEEIRHGHPMNEMYYTGSKDSPYDEHESHNRDGSPRKPEGVPSELADIIIRVLDIADAYDVDLATAVIEKLNHNATRGLHHGGKAL